MTDAGSIREGKSSRLRDPNPEKMEPLVELMGELRGRGESPGPMVHALRRAHSGGPGGVVCSVGRKKGGRLWMTQTPRDIITVTWTSPEKRSKP